MDQNQVFSKDITINKSFTETVEDIKKVPSLNGFTLIEDNSLMNKITIGLQGSKIEVSYDKIDEERTKLHILIRDKNDNYLKTDEITSNWALNFEKALTNIINGTPENFKIQSPSISSATAMEVFAGIAGLILVILGMKECAM